MVTLDFLEVVDTLPKELGTQNGMKYCQPTTIMNCIRLAEEKVRKTRDS